MSTFEIFLLAIAVAMDAFAVSICKGITIKSSLVKSAIKVGCWFGLFQAIMPLIGYFFMDNIEKYIDGIKEFVIFLLLLYIGISMMLEAKKEEKLDDSLSFKTMLILSIATSLDALSVGMSLSLSNISVYLDVLIIGVITFLFSCMGVLIGNKFGNKYKTKAEIIGGIILIMIGIKVLLEYFIH